MSSTFGNITVLYRTECKVELDWKIDDFSKVLSRNYGNNIQSPIFTWADIEWQIDMIAFVPHRSFNSVALTSGEQIRLYLQKNTYRKQLATIFKFGIRLKDGTTETRCLLTKTFNGIENYFGTQEFILNSELIDRQHQLLPEGILTISCLIAHEHILRDSEKYESQDVWSSTFKRMVGCRENSDMTIIIGEQTFPVHKAILAARSDTFATMLESDTEEAKTGIINISDCEASSFKEFLLYLYTGRVENFSHTNVCHLYRIADKYNVQVLKNLCIKYIKKTASTEKFFDIVALANQFDDPDLVSTVQQIFNKYASKILKRDDWKQYVEENYLKANEFLLNFVETSNTEYEEECTEHA